MRKSEKMVSVYLWSFVSGFCSDWNQFSLQLVGGILFGSAMYDTGNIWIRRCAGRSDGTNFLPKIRMFHFTQDIYLDLRWLVFLPRMDCIMVYQYDFKCMLLTSTYFNRE